MRSFLAATALAAVFVFAPAASAQNAFMPYLGYNFDADTPLIGVAARVSAGSLPVAFQPGIEVTLDNGANIQIDGNFVYAFPGASVSPYIGAGVAVLIPDGGDADVAANGIFGVVLNSGFIKPFAQGRVTTDFDNSAISAHVGVALNF